MSQANVDYTIAHNTYIKKIFVYGGNMGKPQDIPFVIEYLK